MKIVQILIKSTACKGGCRGRDRMIVGFTTTCTIKSHSSEVYSIQHYVIKFVSDLLEICGLLRFPPPIKLTAMIELIYC
jgi:hypothetical protein